VKAVGLDVEPPHCPLTLLTPPQGDGQRYKLILRTDPGWDSIAYCYSFDTASSSSQQQQDHQGGHWQTIRIPFVDFFPVFRAKTLKVSDV
jgi:hypothetical protein